MTDTPNVELHIGVEQTERTALTSTLKVLLADEFVLYTKLRNFHWNVRGPYFLTLHQLFETQYEELALAIDEIAERIRQYGVMAPGTLAEFLQLTRLNEQPGVYPDWQAMVGAACTDHETLIRSLREDLDHIDDEVDDEAAEGFLTDLLDKHQKMAWMLRAHLEG